MEIKTNYVNYILFEEYKQLDKLCSEIYGELHGISRYIDDMKKVSPFDYQCLPNWQADLTQLKQIRHIRNYLAHTQGAFDEVICTEEDINWIRDFHSRLLNQSDPLAMLYQYSRTKQQQHAAKPVPQPQVFLPKTQYHSQYHSIEEKLPETNFEKEHPSNRAFSTLGLCIAILVIGVVVVAVLSIYNTLFSGF